MTTPLSFPPTQTTEEPQKPELQSLLQPDHRAYPAPDWGWWKSRRPRLRLACALPVRRHLALPADGKQQCSAPCWPTGSLLSATTSRCSLRPTRSRPPPCMPLRPAVGRTIRASSQKLPSVSTSPRRSNAQPTSTSSTTDSTSSRSPTASSSTHPGSPPSTGSRPSGSFPCTSATTPRPSTSPSVTPTGIRVSTMPPLCRHDPPRHRHRRIRRGVGTG